MNGDTVTCSCGKPLDKIPLWMKEINVHFICNNCPNRDLQNIAHAKFPAEIPTEESNGEA